MRLFGYEIRRVNKNTVNGVPKVAACLHPIHKTVTEFAFEVDGKEFYTFKNLLDMPQRRYQRCMEFIREAEMRITSTELLELIGLIKDALNKGKITDSIIFLGAIENLTSQYLETDTYYRLFSCVFFDMEENLLDYDYDYNEYKIELFKKQPSTGFFFNQPMKKYLPQTDISVKDLEVYLKLTSANKEYLQKIKRDYITKG